MNPLTKLRANCPQKGDKRARIPKKGKTFSEKSAKNRRPAGTISPGGSPKRQRGDFSPDLCEKTKTSEEFSKKRKSAPNGALAVRL